MSADQPAVWTQRVGLCVTSAKARGLGSLILIATALAGSEDRIVQAALAFAQTLLVKPAAGQPKKVN